MTDIFSGNIEKLTKNNSNYRQVLFTSLNGRTQLVLMSLKPMEEIGMERHTDADQFIRVEKGAGKAITGKDLNNLSEDHLVDGSAVLIPANTWHNIINTSNNEDLKVYTIYAPAQHPDKLVQKDKPLMQDGGYYDKYIKYKNKYITLKHNR